MATSANAGRSRIVLWINAVARASCSGVTPGTPLRSSGSAGSYGQGHVRGGSVVVVTASSAASSSASCPCDRGPSRGVASWRASAIVGSAGSSGRAVGQSSASLAPSSTCRRHPAARCVVSGGRLGGAGHASLWTWVAPYIIAATVSAPTAAAGSPRRATPGRVRPVSRAMPARDDGEGAQPGADAVGELRVFGDGEPFDPRDAGDPGHHPAGHGGAVDERRSARGRPGSAAPAPSPDGELGHGDGDEDATQIRVLGVDADRGGMDGARAHRGQAGQADRADRSAVIARPSAGSVPTCASPGIHPWSRNGIGPGASSVEPRT